MKGEPCGLGAPCRDMAEWLREGGPVYERGKLFVNAGRDRVLGCPFPGCGRDLPPSVLESWDWATLIPVEIAPPVPPPSTGAQWTDSHGYEDNDPL